MQRPAHQRNAAHNISVGVFESLWLTWSYGYKWTGYKLAMHIFTLTFNFDSPHFTHMKMIFFEAIIFSDKYSMSHFSHQILYYPFNSDS